MMKSLQDLGMAYIQISPEMQLYIQAMRSNRVIHRDFGTSFSARGDAHSAKCVWVHRPLDAGVRFPDSHWYCHCRSQQHYGALETMGACIARIQDGFFHSPTILPADWRGRRYMNT